ncbi:MAG TPA: phosphomannomutase/phosphoglucomutase [Verrucomicrobiae bacterium]|jgi:phosphomannomutase|nr:phosphomannomutase/phosphoglucomutase [Verrucomicrobiae bacterium]
MTTSALDTIFKAYDIRGKVDSELTSDVIQKVGNAFSNWLPSPGAVAVGRDMRPDSKNLADALIAGLRSAGRDVIDIGQVTSDMIYFATGNYNLAGGAVITASHNPGDYNGIKLCREEAKPVGEDSGLLEVRDLAKTDNGDTAKEQGSLTTKDVGDDWINHVLSFINTDELIPLNIAVDAGNGMAGKIFPEIEPFLPFQVHEMYFELDGTFPNHIANPLEPKNLVDIQKKIKLASCDAGVAFDGDGDRAVLLDERGEPLSGTVMTAILAKYFLEQYPRSTILCNAICGRAATETIEENGGIAIRTRVGHSFIKGEMRKNKAVFAGEHSGHYYFKDNFMADSGLIAAIIALFVLSRSKKKLSELAEPYRKSYVAISETNFEVSDKQAAIDAIAREFNDGNQDRLDGLTVNYPNGWFNVRPSNTEALLRLNAEAKTETELQKLVDRVKEFLPA